MKIQDRFGLIKSDDFNKIARLILKHTKLKNKNIPVLATGITTAYNIADNQLREFFIAHKISKILDKMNVENKLLLINDTLDAFTERHLKLLTKFDPKLKNLDKFLGMPISNIPCPYGCYNSLAEYFHYDLIKKLNSLGIYPIEVLAHKIYNNPEYKNLVKELLIRHDEIRDYLKNRYGLNYQNGLFKPICGKCGKLVNTEFVFFKNNKVRYVCKNCGNVSRTLSGKFVWRIECIFRWIANDVDFEPFFKNYLTKPNGSYWVSSDLSLKFFNFLPPLTIQIEYIRYNKELANLADFLPYTILEDLYLENFHRTNCFNKYEIIAKAKAFKYPSGISFFQASMIIGSIFLDNYKRNCFKKINDFVFRFNTNDSNFWDCVTKNVNLAKNFYETIVPPEKRVKLNRVEEIKLPNNKKDKLLLLEFLKKGEKIKTEKKNKVSRLIYNILFNKPFGPSLKTVANLLSEEYKNSLIKKIFSDIHEKDK